MDITLIGYSGHAYVLCDILIANGYNIKSYCDQEEKIRNPYRLVYLGSENTKQAQLELKQTNYFIAIGNNSIRQNVFIALTKTIQEPINAIHQSSIVSPSAKISKGVMIGINATINAQSNISDGVICNTGCIVEHDCDVQSFAHIAPGAVLAGNVSIGKRTFVGANAVIKQGITIGQDVIIGAGAVVLKDIPDNCTVVGNPAKIIKNNVNRSNS